MENVSQKTAACRSVEGAPDMGPVLTWALGGAFWWCAAALLGLIASIKFHGPGFLADVSWLTYGRVRVAATQVGFWGAVVPVVLAAVLGWLGRWARGGVAFPALAMASGKVWHFGTLLALIGILRGDLTGYDGWGLPRYAVWIYAAGFALYLLTFLGTWHGRQERSLGPAHWFLLTGVLWLAWSAATAFVLLEVHPVRGVTQAVVDGWFHANATLVAGTLLGLGLMYGWLPVVTGRPLYSRHLAILTYAGLLVFVSWTGVLPSSPVPAWLPAVATVATVMGVVPWLAAWLNWRKSVGEAGHRLSEEPAGWFLRVAHAAFVAAAVGKLALHLPGLDRVLELTWWEPARQWAQVQGFVGLAGVAGVYAWLGGEGRLTGWRGLGRWQGRLAMAGLAVGVLALAAAGVAQGLAWRDPALSNVAVLGRTLMWLRLSTVGDLLWWLGTVLFVVNLAGVTLRWWVGCWRSWWAQVTAPVKLQEAAE